MGAADPVTVRSVDDVRALLETTINELRTLENSVSRARTTATLATVTLKAFEIGELEQRIEALEARL